MCVKESTIINTLKMAEEKYKQNGNIIMTVLQISLPPMWIGSLNLDQFVDTPMHQLFEGLVKSSLEILSQYLKYHKSGQNLVK